jgi:hypothetical protein
LGANLVKKALPRQVAPQEPSYKQMYYRAKSEKLAGVQQQQAMPLGIPITDPSFSNVHCYKKFH